MNDKEKLEEAKSILKTIYEDATMALKDEWDRTDDGFESQQILIQRFFNSIGEEI